MYECLIPWRLLKFDPESGKPFGFCVQFNESDGWWRKGWEGYFLQMGGHIIDPRRFGEPDPAETGSPADGTAHPLQVKQRQEAAPQAEFMGAVPAKVFRGSPEPGGSSRRRCRSQRDQLLPVRPGRRRERRPGFAPVQTGRRRGSDTLCDTCGGVVGPEPVRFRQQPVPSAEIPRRNHRKAAEHVFGADEHRPFLRGKAEADPRPSDLIRDGTVRHIPFPDGRRLLFFQRSSANACSAPE